MKTMGVIIVQITFLILTTSALSQPCTPAPDQVALYLNDNFEGDCITLDEGSFHDEKFFRRGVSSIKVGSNARAKLCGNKNKEFKFVEPCEYFNKNDASLSDNKIGNDKVISVLVFSASEDCNPAEDEVALFMHDDYGGFCKKIKATGRLGVNEHYFGFPEKQASSIKVGSNAIAKLCSGRNFHGNCQYIYYPGDNSLTDNLVGNDKVSSVQVFSASKKCNPAADEVALFIHDNYGGFCKILKGGYYLDGYGIGLPGGISSIKVGSNAIAKLCGDRNFHGTCQHIYYPGDNSLTDNPVGNDKVSSVHVLSGSPNCTPAADEVALFLHGQYKGYCTKLKKGFYFDAETMNFGDNQLTSVRIGSNAAIVLYEKNDFRGIREIFRVSDPNLSDNTIGNDSVSSAAVFASDRNCVPKNNQVAVYSHTNFGGLCSNLDYGVYPHTAHTNLPNDTISSIRVGEDAEVLLCREMDFGGYCKNFRWDDAYLEDNGLNDTVSSLIISEPNSIEIAKEWWYENLGPGRYPLDDVHPEKRKYDMQPQIKHRQKVAIVLWDPVRPYHPVLSSTYIYNKIYGLHNSVNAYYRENSSSLYQIEIVGFYGWLSPETRKLGNFYWDYSDPEDNKDNDGFTSGHTMRWSNAISALDRRFHFAEKYDKDGNGVLTPNEIGIVIFTPEDTEAGFQRSFHGGNQKKGEFLKVDNDLEVHKNLEIYSGIQLPVGLAAHEFGHITLGLRDMYSGGLHDEWYNPYSAISFSLMASGMNYNSHLDAVLKLKLGWVVPQLIMASGQYLITDVESTNRVWVILDPSHSYEEYFVIENRWPGKTYDKLPDSGIAIWHVIEDPHVNRNVDKPFCTPQAQWDKRGTGWERRAIRLIRRNPLPWARINDCEAKTPLADDNNALWREWGLQRTLRWADGTDSGIMVLPLTRPGKTMTVRVTYQ